MLQLKTKSGKDSRTNVVLARKLEKQGLGSTPDTDVNMIQTGMMLLAGYEGSDRR